MAWIRSLLIKKLVEVADKCMHCGGSRKEKGEYFHNGDLLCGDCYNKRVGRETEERRSNGES